MKVKSESEVTQSCLTLSDPMDCSLPGSSVHGFSRQEYWNGMPLPSSPSLAIGRIARRDKKTFLSDQCEEIEENNRMGRTRDLVKKIRDAKRTFHAKIGLIKDRNGMDFTEAEDIKKTWQE